MFPLSERNRQRGDILVESLIGVLLMSIIGLGVSYTASRATVSQRDMKLQQVVIAQMRNLLEQHGTALCSDATLAAVRVPGQANTLPLTVTCGAATTVSMGGRSITGGSAVVSVVLSTRDQDSSLFGGTLRVGDET